MRVQLLGQVQLIADEDVVVPVPAAKRRSVLASLAVDLNRVVSTERLLDLVWDRRPPPRARTALQVHVSELRKSLGSGLQLETRAPGYVLLADPALVDIHQFTVLVSRAEQVPIGEAVGLLRAALDLWQGPALADVTAHELREIAAARLTESRLAALGQLADMLVELGRGQEILAELSDAVVANQLREPLVGSLMRVLEQTGRRTEALLLFERTSANLAEALGVDPGPHLIAIRNSVARNAAHPRSEPKPPVAHTEHHATAMPERPAQLPREATGFVGRESEVDWLNRLLAAESSGLAVVVGPGGVGKTSLVLHWAHRVAAHFPDGQIFVDPGAFGDTGPLATETVLDRFLRVLGVSQDRLPTDLDHKAGLFRTLVAGRRLLLILDNASSYEQVRLLLPGHPSTVAVVTSRIRLDGLVVENGAARLDVGVFSDAESLRLLGTMVADRVAGDPAAVARLIELCDHLPLALRLVASQLLLRPHRQVSDIVSDLTDERLRLENLATDDADISVETVLAASFHALPADAAHMFRMLGLHLGPSIDTSTAASLAGLPLASARRALNSLVAVHLTNETTVGRFRYHDLVRIYAKSLAEELPPVQRRTALRRLANHHLAATAVVRRLLSAPDHPVQEPDPTEHPGHLPPMATIVAALDWFEVEEPTIRSLIRDADAHGDYAVAWRLMDNATICYARRGVTADWLASAGWALHAARADGDVAARISMLRTYGAALAGLNRMTEAQAAFDEGLELADGLPDDADRTSWLTALATQAALRLVGRDTSHYEKLAAVSSSINGFEHALLLNTLSRARLAADDPLGALERIGSAIAVADYHSLNSVRHELLHTHGLVLARLGRLDDAWQVQQRAVGLAEESGDERTRLACLNALVRLAEQRGSPAEAEPYRHTAEELSRRLGVVER